MRIIPYYFIMTLFIGFMLIYIFGNDYYVITKHKKKYVDGECINCK